jgi:hypothetical protein
MTLPIPEPSPETSDAVASAVDALEAYALYAGGNVSRTTAELLIWHLVHLHKLSPGEITGTLRQFERDVVRATKVAETRQRWIAEADAADTARHPGPGVAQPGGNWLSGQSIGGPDTES